MKPTLKLRWQVYKNPVTTDEVRAEARLNGGALSQAKRRLEKETPPVLQQWWEDEQRGEWRNIDIHVEPHPE